MDKEKLVPKLRFSGFDEEWKKSNLGNVSSAEMYGMNSAAKDYDGFNKYIRITDISETSNKFIPNPLTSPDGNLEDKYKLKKGDIVFARTGASTGKTYLYDENDGNLYFAGFLIKFHIDNANPKFIFYNTLKEEYLNWISVMSVRSGQPGINSNEYKKLPINLPSLDEQKKISNFLTLIDKKIMLLEHKRELYQNFKKYLMQQIFAQKLRFPNFNENWEFKRLGDVSTVKDGTHDSPKYVDEGYPLITSKNLLGDKIDFENVNYISKSDYDSINKRSNVDKGDILFGMIGTIGKPVITDSDNFAIKNVALIKENDELLNNFLIYVLDTDLINKQFYLLNAGGTQKFIALGSIKDLLVPIPSIKEQIKISNFLNLVDNNLIEYINQLDNTKKFKKGLLQQMFV